ncbi:hypothetical protein DL765_002165 [Monosporascus sp. GIB2]|nr:hypothetical protein DL765_002165 [Monosporascus sp. GIB2]
MGPSCLRVIIVGGGLTELTAAHMLSKAGIDSVLLEKGDTCMAEVGVSLVGGHGGKASIQTFVSRDRAWFFLYEELGRPTRERHRYSKEDAARYAERWSNLAMTDRHEVKALYHAALKGTLVDLQEGILDVFGWDRLVLAWATWQDWLIERWILPSLRLDRVLTQALDTAAIKKTHVLPFLEDKKFLYVKVPWENCPNGIEKPLAKHNRFNWGRLLDVILVVAFWARVAAECSSIPDWDLQLWDSRACSERAL